MSIITRARRRTAGRATLLLLAVYGMAAPTPQPQAAVLSQAQDTPRLTTAAEPAEAPSRELLTSYCVTCHNEKLKTGGLALDHADVEHVADNPELWEKVAWKIRIGAMPKVPAPRPDKATLDRFASAVEKALDRAAAASPNTGRPTLHRLNRLEYVNAIHDLLGLEVDGPTLLPTDESSYGFDNSQGLSITPSLLDRYMSAAAKISRVAVGDSTIRPTTEVYPIAPSVRQDERMSEDLPFGTNGGIAVRHTFPVDGEYEIRVSVPARLGRPRSEIVGTVDRAPVAHWSLEAAAESRVAIVAAEAAENVSQPAVEETLTVRFVAKAGTHTVGVAFLNTRAGYAEGLGGGVAGPSGTVRRGAAGNIESIAVSGPYKASTPQDSVSRRRIFICSPADPKEEGVCARKILAKLARRGFRRPVSTSDINVLMRFYETGRHAGGFNAGMQAALERILISPEFLFRIERGPAGAKPGTVFQVSDIELASRLSFFLWSSIPDDELLDVAESGKLKEPAVLAKQARRMLADRRATLLANNFAGQWLLTRNTRVVEPDPRLFPIDANLKEALARETELFFESQLRDDKSVLDLLRANYTYLNERLAAHYGIPNVYGSHFRRVALTDERRFGILGKGSVMMVTSHADRTSPVVRGRWIAENLLGAPPPPPPPNVPPLPANNAETPTTVRERLELHRKNPVCAACHSMMDPFGFALENFDVTGKWRDSDSGKPVDTSGVLLDGTKMEGVVGLRNALLTSSTQFATVFTERLLTYALGRGVESHDRPAVRNIVREATSRDYRWSDIILGIVRSTPFQMNRTPLAEKQPGAQTVAIRK